MIIITYVTRKASEMNHIFQKILAPFFNLNGIFHWFDHKNWLTFIVLWKQKIIRISSDFK